MNAELHKELTRLGVSAPEKETQHLSESAVAGVIRWTRDEGKAGRAPSSNVIVYKLRNGGLEGYGTLSDGPRAWYRISASRWRWMEQNLPDLEDFFYAEAAILQLVNRKQEPNPQAVKALAYQLAKEQAEHDALCLAGRDRRGGN